MLDYIQHMWNLDLGDDRQGVWFWGAVNAFLICGYSILFQLIIRSCPSTRGQLNHLGLDKFGAAIILSDQDYHADALFTYQIEHKIYHGKCLDYHR